MEYRRSPVQKLMQLAARESYSLYHESVDTEHLLLAMMKTGGIETQALVQAGANYDTLRKIVVNNSEEGTSTSPGKRTSIAVRRMMQQAQQMASQNGDREVYADHFLLVLLNDRTSLAHVMLTIADVDKKAIYQYIVEAMQDYHEEDDSSNLARYGTNLNRKAEEGKIDPIIGRDKEMNRVIQILSRRTKNNPVLIGEPGVGKTAIAEGLAQRIVTGDIPDIMRKKTVYSLDMATMVAGTKYRGDFEQRLNDTLDELMERDDVIVFIDELHTIIGAGSAEGTLDASNILKPALSKGDLQLIGATTIDEYRQKIEKDAALERRFQPVMVEEPSKEESKHILHGLRAKYEAFHQVRISDEAIDQAVELTDRYLTDRFLPDKAIDVIDEALARVHVKDFKISSTLLAYEKKIAELELEKTEAALTQDFERAASLRDELLSLNEEMEEEMQTSHDHYASWPEITFDEVAQVVSQWAKVPVTKLSEEESDKYLYLQDRLKTKVIGQDYAVDTISQALKRARVGLKSPNRPIGSFIFVGPTGVGKTHLAKKMAEVLFGDVSHLIRIDMSEYMEKYTVSRLVGSAPGYIGYEEGGQLTEAVRSKPYSVVLFDEIEKAHPDVFNILLQVLDDGRLTDNKGRTVDFRNTIIIMTSNVGASRLQQSNKLGFGVEEDVEKSEHERMKEIIHEDLKKTFRPEFLNRLDDIVIFHRLDQDSIATIAKILLDDLMNRVENLGYHLSYTDAVVQKLAKDGFSPEFGARPLERQIRSKVEDILAEKMLDHSLEKDKHYDLCIRQGDLAIVEKPQVVKEEVKQ